jgi:hypothetical protein
MFLKYAPLMLILAAGASVARADLTITVANNIPLQPNAADQVIFIDVLGGDPVQGDMFYVQIADGGPQANAYITGPTITKLDVITNTIFAPFNSPQTPSDTGYVIDQLASAGTTIPRESAIQAVAGSGRVATITISTLGWFGGTWDLCLKDTVGGASTQFGDVPLTITNGSITIVPEPATGLLALAGASLLLRRRRARI